MKLIKYISVCLLLCTVIIINSCGEKATIDSVTPAVGARVKFLHAIQGGTPIVVFANGQKWSARLNTVANGPDSLVYGDVFPSTDYSVFAPGEASFDLKTTAAAAVLSGKTTLEDGKYYTVIAADTALKPRLVAIQDDRSAIKSSVKTYLRFVNLVAGAPTYDIIYARNRVYTTMATLKYGDASSVVEFDPYPAGITVNDSVYVRAQGTTANLVSLSLGTGLTANRLRTYVIRGKVGTIGVNTILNN